MPPSARSPPAWRHSQSLPEPGPWDLSGELGPTPWTSPDRSSHSGGTSLPSKLSNKRFAERRRTHIAQGQPPPPPWLHTARNRAGRRRVEEPGGASCYRETSRPGHAVSPLDPPGAGRAGHGTAGRVNNSSEGSRWSRAGKRGQRRSIDLGPANGTLGGLRSGAGRLNDSALRAERGRHFADKGRAHAVWTIDPRPAAASTGWTGRTSARDVRLGEIRCGPPRLDAPDRGENDRGWRDQFRGSARLLTPSKEASTRGGTGGSRGGPRAMRPGTG